MSVVTSTWHQLVHRRLWPVAVVLLVALVAIPVVLARDPEGAEVPAPAPVGGTNVEDSPACKRDCCIAKQRNGGPQRCVDPGALQKGLVAIAHGTSPLSSSERSLWT